MPFYTGIGSRETPPQVCDLMTRLATRLQKQYILRSGGANGADQAFERGVTLPHSKEIYLPWTGFNSHLHDEDNGYLVGPNLFAWEAAKEMALEVHPNPKALQRSNAVWSLMARNIFQILGRDLHTPSQFVICWTPNGSGSGGTGQAIRLARQCGIPVRDLGNHDTLEAAERFLST